MHDDDWLPRDVGVGSYSGFTAFRPTRAELRAIKQRRPIGFVTFPDRERKQPNPSGDKYRRGRGTSKPT